MRLVQVRVLVQQDLGTLEILAPGGSLILCLGCLRCVQTVQLGYIPLVELEVLMLWIGVVVRVLVKVEIQ